MIFVQLFFTFARSTIGRYVIAGVFGLMTAVGVYWSIKAHIRADLRNQAIREQQERVNDAIRRGDAVPDDADRLRGSPADRKWCRDC